MNKLKVLDLFSGIGGFSLGLERTGGFETVAFCEIEEFPRKVLAKHWPEVPQYHDVRELTADQLAADGITVDVITGGFPCQDISTAGKQAGISEGTRSGLWSEIVRLTRELSPRYVIVENVANLLSGPSEKRGGWFGRVLGDLADLGFCAEWASVPASSIGGPHERERIWIVAYPNGQRSTGLRRGKYVHGAANKEHFRPKLQISKKNNDGLGGENGNANAYRVPGVDHGVSQKLDGGLNLGESQKTRSPKIMPAVRERLHAESVHKWPFGGSWSILEAEILRKVMPGNGASKAWRDPQANNDEQGKKVQKEGMRKLRNREQTSHTPQGSQHSKQCVGELDDSMRSLSQQTSRRSDRIKGLGNAVVPQIPEMIGHAILEAERNE